MTVATNNYTFIIFFCIAVFITIRLSIDTGHRADFVKQTGITTFILFILAVAFAFAFISPDWITAHPYISLVLIILPVILIILYASPRTNSSLNNLSLYFNLPYKILLLVCAIAFIILLWINNPAGMFTTKYSTTATVFVLLMGIFGLLTAIVALAVPQDSAGLFYTSLKILFGFITSAMFIGWLVWIITKHTQKTGWLSIVFLVALMYILYALIGALFSAISSAPGTAVKSNAFINLLNATILYIPCLFNGWLNTIKRMLGMSSTASLSGMAASNIAGTAVEIWALLAVSIALLIGYYYLPGINQKVYIGDCRQLLRDPITLHGATTVATYDQLSGNSGNDDTTTATFDYKYGISLWYYLDSHGANMSSAYNVYTPIFNYGNKPVIEYNARTNSLRIKMGGAKEEGRVVYEARGTVSLQKWTNIVVNYNGGTVDVFVDGVLIKSTDGVAPYMSLDNVVVGSQDGLYGRCCNVIYRPQPFTASQIYYLQYLVKDSNPPVFSGQFI